MPKPPPAAATKQSCLQRLQSLQEQFLHIDSPAELSDAEREGGLILAQLLHYGLIEPAVLVADPSREICTMLKQGLHRWTLGEKLKDLSARALGYRPHPVAHEALSESMEARWGLWFKVAGESYSPRTIYHPITKSDHPLPEGQYEYEEVMSTDSEPGYTIAWPIKDFKRQSPPIRIWGYQTFPEKDYRRQGKRYALFTAELIARIEATQAAPLDAEQNATDKPKQARGMSKPERERIVAGILATEGTQRKLTAKDVYQIATKAGHRTSESAVKATEAFRYYTERIGTSRQKNRPTEYSSDRLEELADESRHIKRTARKTKPLEPEE